MHGTVGPSQSVGSPLPPGHCLEETQYLPSRNSAFQPQNMSLRKQCIFMHHQQQVQDLNSRDYSHSTTMPFRSLSPRRDYQHWVIPEERSYNTYRQNQERCLRSLSPVSFTVPRSHPRSLSPGSNTSYQSSSADDSCREGSGGAASSGIGLSESSADDSRRTSVCSRGAIANRLDFHSNTFTLVENISSQDGSSISRLNDSELATRNVAIRSFNERAKSEQGNSNLVKRTQSIDSLENELTCPICLDLFHEPVFLPCAHNLCTSCVEQLTTSNRTVGKMLNFECPTCRESVYIDNNGVAGLRRNLTLQNIVDGYRRATASAIVSHNSPPAMELDVSSGEESSVSNVSSQSDGSMALSRSRRRTRSSQPEGKAQYMSLPKRDVNSRDSEISCQFCEVEPPRLAVSTCLTCQAYYCDRCLRVTHPRKKPFTNHELAPALPGSIDTFSATHNPKTTFVTCLKHTQASADLFCFTCENALCKICSSCSDHDNHQIGTVYDWCNGKKVQLETQVVEMKKQKQELQRTIENMVEACQQTEVNASSQESKLQAEFDILMRILQERKEVISNKIKETKGSRIRKLTQQINEAKQCLESYEPVTGQAQEAIQQADDHMKFVKVVKETSERIVRVLSSSKQFETRQQELSAPGFYFEFSQEKQLLEKLDMIKTPATPRICEELCTQSHDKISIQWRSPDHRHTDSYQVLYSIDNNNNSTLSSKQEGWMIVPNIKECHYTINGLQSGTRYLFAIKATNKAGSSRSECLPIKTLGVPFAFDKHSMHKKLRLGSHGYTVAKEDSNRKSKEHSLSGSSMLCGVAGNVEIECGRHYWEVVVCQSTHFTLGVAYSNNPRYEWIGKNSSSWCLCRTNDEWFVRHGGKEIPVKMPLSLPKKIGVMLDYDSGVLSFFDGASGNHVHTFRVGTFERSLCPAFSIGNHSLTINTGITIPDHLRLKSSIN